MKKFIFWALGILPIIVTSIAVRFLPDVTPRHRNFSGEIDAWGSKYLAFLGASIAILMCFFFYALICYMNKKATTSIDDKEIKQYENNSKILWYSGIVIALFENVIHYFGLYNDFKAVNYNSNVGFDLGFFNIILGITFILLGNFLPKAKMNSVFGLRTKWSMMNDKTWSVCQRNGGILLVISGIAYIICGSVINNATMSLVVMMTIPCLIIPFAFIISHSAYKKYGIEKLENN